MSIFPKIEKITRDTAISHFLLMFGYRIFSVYFPLFLVAKNFSIPQIGYAHFLIYLPIALFAPIIGFFNHKINSATLMALGILGYGIYSLGMIIFPNHLIFYLFQVILGISASLFFVSSRAILMGSKLENPPRAFAWFYSFPSFGDAVSPAVGAFLIWKFGFTGVFIFSLVIQFFTAIFCFIRLRKQTGHLTEPVKIKESGQNYLKILAVLRKREIYPFVLISFLVLVLAGFNNAFFVLFLKNFGFSFNQILIFNSVLSLVFVPLSIWTIKRISKLKSERNVSLGSQIVGIFSILLGAFAGVLNFFSVFFIMLGKYVGGLMAGSGRSGLLTTKLKEYPEESAAVDTIFSPLATATGALVGGLIILPLGYPLIFIVFGVLIFGAGTIKMKTHVRD
jgi:MFS family permease